MRSQGSDGSFLPSDEPRSLPHIGGSVFSKQEEIGTIAGTIWHALNTKGELSLAQLKRDVNGKTPLFDWAVGWLAREDKIVITPEKRSFRLRLKESHAKAAGSS